MIKDSISSIIIDSHKIIYDACKKNKNRNECIINYYVEFGLYLVLCPYLFVMFLYNISVKRDPLIAYIYLMLFMIFVSF